MHQTATVWMAHNRQRPSHQTTSASLRFHSCLCCHDQRNDHFDQQCFDSLRREVQLRCSPFNRQSSRRIMRNTLRCNGERANKAYRMRARRRCFLQRRTSGSLYSRSSMFGMTMKDLQPTRSLRPSGEVGGRRPKCPAQVRALRPKGRCEAEDPAKPGCHAQRGGHGSTLLVASH